MNWIFQFLRFSTEYFRVNSQNNVNPRYMVYIYYIRTKIFNMGSTKLEFISRLVPLINRQCWKNISFKFKKFEVYIEISKFTINFTAIFLFNVTHKTAIHGGVILMWEIRKNHLGKIWWIHWLIDRVCFFFILKIRHSRNNGALLSYKIQEIFFNNSSLLTDFSANLCNATK